MLTHLSGFGLDAVAALAAFYADYDKLTHCARVQDYLKALEGMAIGVPQRAGDNARNKRGNAASKIEHAERCAS
jgi:hypothetical protein